MRITIACFYNFESFYRWQWIHQWLRGGKIAARREAIWNWRGHQWDTTYGHQPSDHRGISMRQRISRLDLMSMRQACNIEICKFDSNWRLEVKKTTIITSDCCRISMTNDELFVTYVIYMLMFITKHLFGWFSKMDVSIYLFISFYLLFLYCFFIFIFLMF